MQGGLIAGSRLRQEASDRTLYFLHPECKELYHGGLLRSITFYSIAMRANNLPHIAVIGFDCASLLQAQSTTKTIRLCPGWSTSRVRCTPRTAQQDIEGLKSELAPMPTLETRLAALEAGLSSKGDGN